MPRLFNCSQRQRRWRALAESMDSARQAAVRARGLVPAQAAIMPGALARQGMAEWTKKRR